MFKRGEEDRPTLENRRKKYIYHVCILKTTFSAVLLTRRIYNISSSSSFAVSSSTNLLLVLTRTRTHICVVIAVVSPPPWVYFGLCIRRSLPSIGCGLCESYIYLGFEEGVEFIPDVPKFPPSLLHIYIHRVSVCVCHRYIHIFVYLYSVKRVSFASVRLWLIYLIFSLRWHRNPPRPRKVFEIRYEDTSYDIRDNCCCSCGKLYYTIYIFIRFGTRFLNLQRSHRHVWISYSHTSTCAVVAAGQQFFYFIIRRAVKSFLTRLTGLHLYGYYYDFQNEN